MEQAPLYNKWRVKTPGNPIMFANCNSKNTSETGLYIHWFWAEAFWEVVEAYNNRGKNIYPDVTSPRRHHELYTRSQGTILERLEHFSQGQKFSCVDEFIKRWNGCDRLLWKWASCRSPKKYFWVSFGVVLVLQRQFIRFVWTLLSIFSYKQWYA